MKKDVTVCEGRTLPNFAEFFHHLSCQNVDICRILVTILIHLLDVFISKVIALATFIALVIKTPNADEDEDMEDDEEEFELANDELWLHEPSGMLVSFIGRYLCVRL